MRHLPRNALFAVTLSLVFCLALLAPLIAAQEPPAGPPPEIGPVLREDPLTGPGAVTASECPTHRNARVFVGEGYLFKVTGKCTDAATNAAVSQPIEGLTVPDGEISIEAKVVSGLERARLRIWFRYQDTGNPAYYVALEPARGLAQLGRWSPQQTSWLAQRTDLADVLSPDGWNVIALRAQGPGLWLLLNGQPVLSTVDAGPDSGGAMLDVLRLGNVDDTDESAVVFRNLRVSPLATGDQARLPTYALPEPRIERIVFLAPQEGRMREDATEVGCGAAQGNPLCLIGGFIYYRDVTPGNRITARWLWNGAPIDRSTGIEDWTPPAPSGRADTLFNANFGAGGMLTLVVDINGREMARRDIPVR